MRSPSAGLSIAIGISQTRRFRWIQGAAEEDAEEDVEEDAEEDDAAAKESEEVAEQPALCPTHTRITPSPKCALVERLI